MIKTLVHLDFFCNVLLYWHMSSRLEAGQIQSAITRQIGAQIVCCVALCLQILHGVRLINTRLEGEG